MPSKLTNEQAYTTIGERVMAHSAYCKAHTPCPINEKCQDCAFKWLSLPYEEEKAMPCPFCNNRDVTESMTLAGGVFIDCKCGYRSEIAVGGKPHELKLKAIEKHNRVCRAMKAASGSEVK